MRRAMEMRMGLFRLEQGEWCEVWMLGAQVLLPEGCADARGGLRVRSLLRAQLRAL